MRKYRLAARRVELSFYPQNGALSMHDDDDGFAAAQRDI